MVRLQRRKNIQIIFSGIDFGKATTQVLGIDGKMTIILPQSVNVSVVPRRPSCGSPPRLRPCATSSGKTTSGTS